MLPDARLSQILQLVEMEGFVSVKDIVDRTGASESTVRRDLEHLDGIGQVRRTRGGAAFIGDSLTDFEDRKSKNIKEKQRVAEAAAELIEPGEAVLLDGGTTTLEVARLLVGKSLNVVTNSLPICNLLAGQPGIELVMVGGYVYPKTGVALGPMAVEALRNLHARRLFMSVGGITEKGLFNRNALLVETERQMIEAADEVVVVSDSGKFGHSALARLCPLETVDRMIVDSGITDEWRRTVQGAGVELTVVDV